MAKLKHFSFILNFIASVTVVKTLNYVICAVKKRGK